jgi:DNA-binding MarR family transcriptional regulator
MKYDGNYIHKPHAITQHPQLTFAEQDYLCLIAQLSNHNGCTASNAWFARYFSVKPPRASEVIGSLVKKGFLRTIEERTGKKVVKRTLEIIDEGIKEILIRILRNPYGDIKDLPAKDTKEMTEDKLNSKTKDKTKDKTHVSDCLFEEFWKAYPKKVSKAQASKAFRKLNPYQALLDALLT